MKKLAVAALALTLLVVTAGMATAVRRQHQRVSVAAVPAANTWTLDLTPCLTEDPCSVAIPGDRDTPLRVIGGTPVQVLQGPIEPGDIINAVGPTGGLGGWLHGLYLVDAVTRQQFPPGGGTLEPITISQVADIRLREVWNDGTVVMTRVYLDRVYN